MFSGISEKLDDKITKFSKNNPDVNPSSDVLQSKGGFTLSSRQKVSF